MHIYRLFPVMILLVIPHVAASQPWVGPTHEISLSLTTAFQYSSRTFEGPITLTGIPATQWRNTLGVGFIPIKNLSIELSPTWQADKYFGPQKGANPNIILAHGSYDDGSWHGTFSDLDASLRYMAYDDAITITPMIVAKIPMTNYEQKGYAAAGTGLNEIGAGLLLGKMGAFTDRLDLWGGYTFTYVQKEAGGGEETLQYRTNYSLFRLGAIYQLGDKLLVGGGPDVLITHDGFDLSNYPSLPTNSTLRVWHDPVLKREYLAINAFTFYQFTKTLTGGVVFAIIPVGDNVSDAKTLGVTVNWTGLSF